ncbi:MAG TPA: hypothetical protein VGL20_17875 [Candidatus Dormibacteraeota bacterium]
MGRFPRCPFAAAMLDSAAACPGFVAEVLPIAVEHPTPERTMACAHLGSQPAEAPGRWEPICRHAGGLPTGALQAAAHIRAATRARPLVARPGRC